MIVYGKGMQIKLRHRVEESVTDTKNKEENSPETTVENVP